ncbi:MAG TPA: helix-turn-helix domain-containing protein [Candidatus Faecousia intestinigallinarum]|nr:helix-turn-helix domain-containing protein [Candidatus Faecousia intestinigallinarum]
MYRLLIVDSDKKACEKIKDMLDWSAYGFTAVMTASSYADGAGKAVDFLPHVALVDMHLGEQMGYELVEHLRAVGLKTVFCMISNEDDATLIRRSMWATAQGYLLKPLNGKELRAFVERVVVNDLGGTLPESIVARNEIDPVLKVEYSKLSKITNKIILVVKSDYHQPQTLAAIAESFHMSSKYIGRVFLKDTGIKFSEYLMAYRMLEARRLIVSTREKISAIANMVGYVQLNNFYIHFKNYFGVSPSVLRNFEEAAPQAAEKAEDPRQ